MKTKMLQWVFLFATALVLGGCGTQSSAPVSQAQSGKNMTEPKVIFTLQTAMMDGKMVFVGSGAEIDGVINPDLEVVEGEIFQIVLINGDGIPHDIAIPDIGLQTPMVLTEGQQVSLMDTASSGGTYAYFCTLTGHRQAGMEGKLIVREGE